MKQLILVLTLAALVGHSLAQGNRKCAANGEYCLLHSDCCSGSCLSFSYKCVPVPPGPIVGTTFVPVDLSNRFGGPDDGGASITQKTCAKNGEYCQIGAECCSGECLSYSYKCVPVQPPLPGADVKPQESTPVTTPVELDNRFDEGQSTTPVTTAATTTSTTKSCAALGEYCLLSTECCSGACLSFSYKCVTNPKVDVVGQPPLVPVKSPSRPAVTGDLANRFDGTSNVTPTTPKKCAAVGEYCLTASDCCSQSCLSFSYKCVQNYDLGMQQLTPSGIPVQVRPTGGSGTNAIDTSNRFGGGEQQCTTNGLRCHNNNECCSGACYKSYCARQITLGTPESELTRPSASNGPYVQVNSLDDLITRFGGGSPAVAGDSNTSASTRRANTHVGSRSITGKHCFVTGDTCSRHEDCCSLRCMSYRRQCVT